jgi:hypothetical protein
MDNLNNFENKTAAAQSDRQTYHTPRLVNLGEIHSLVMAGHCGGGDVDFPDGAS